MIEEQILENNKLIAQFMGYMPTSKEIGEQTFTHDTMEKGTVIWLSQFKYHSSWDWLMPVVEKIETEQGCIIEMWLSLGKGCKINRLQSKSEGGILHFANESNSLIEAVCQSVVEFIKWYNITALNTNP